VASSDFEFSVYAAAREYGCSSHWMRTLLAEGRLAGARKVGREWRIPAEAIELLRTHRRAGGSLLTAEQNIAPPFSSTAEAPPQPDFCIAGGKP
jgi:hypothetical protein